MPRNLIGEKFGRLTVIEKTDMRKHGNIVWKCQCDCGNMHYAYTNLLTSGEVKSCGCLHRETAQKIHSKNDIIGFRFGKLTAIAKHPTKKAPNGSFMIICKCDCGNTILVTPQNLRTHHTSSCGCLKTSIGEYKIEQLLKEYNIPFEKEKKFETCRNPKSNYPLRFDFYVNNEYLIEYDGKQHSQADGGWGEDINDIQMRDNYKTKWCNENNINLIRISYLHYDKMTIDDLIPKNSKTFLEYREKS